MQRLGFGRFERLKIVNGEPVLAPWPLTVRGIRFGWDTADKVRTETKEFALKQQVAELLAYIRSAGTGEIRTLEFRHGLPFAMEVNAESGDADFAREKSRGALP
jgi:hypothetical protein